MSAHVCNVERCGFAAVTSITALGDLYERFATNEYELDLALGYTSCQALARSVERLGWVDATPAPASEIDDLIRAPFEPLSAAEVAGEIGSFLPPRHRRRSPSWWERLRARRWATDPTPVYSRVDVLDGLGGAR